MMHLFTSLKNTYLYDIQLKYKLLISHGLLIFLPTLVLSCFLYSRLYDSIVSDTILSEQEVAGQAVSSIEAAFSEVKQVSFDLEATNAASFLFSEYAGGLTANSTAAYAHTLIRAAEQQTQSTLVTDVQIYTDASYLYEADTEAALFSPLSTISGSYWYGIFSANNISTLLCPSVYLSVTEEETRGDLAYITQISSESGREIYLAVYFSSDQLSSLLVTNNNLENSAAYILNSRDDLISTSDSKLSGGYYMSNDTLSTLVGGINFFTTKTYLSDSIYVGYFSIPNTDWYLVSILSASSLIHRGQVLVFQFLGIYVAFFILALIFSIFLSHSISRRIGRLSRQMEQVHQERPQPIHGQMEARDEIGMLVNTYNYMSDEINQLMDQQLAAAEDLKLAEYRALQSQINPHFLYNSLDMIHWLSQSGQPKEAAEVVQALSRFYKLTLSKNNTAGTVGMELEHAQLYVQLQNMRFENRILFVTDMPDTLMDYKIPKLTLQPIIENCIQHGIMEKPDRSGTILLTGWLEGEDLVLLISDDGVGMDEETKRTILSGERRPSVSIKSGSNIGIYNTHSRLQLLYGAAYGLHYESTLGEGTDTQIRIPAHKIE